MSILFSPNQHFVFISMLVLGCVLGVIYDALKVKRMIFGSFYLAVFFDDLLFSFVSFTLFVLCIFAFNSGIVRWFEFVACFIGFLVYRFTISRVVIKIFELVTSLFRKLIKFIIKLVLWPVKHIKNTVFKISMPLTYKLERYSNKYLIYGYINKLKCRK